MDRAILLDEAFYPLKKLHCPVAVSREGPHILVLFEALQRLKATHASTNPDLAALVINKLPGEHRGTTYTKNELCQDTVDARDFFRMFTSVDDRTRQFILTPLKTGKLDSVAQDPCRDRCFEAGHAQCTEAILALYEGAGVGIQRAPRERVIEDILVYRHTNDFDSLGNLMVCPPTAQCPNGAIIYGNSTPHDDMDLDFTWTPQCPQRPANLAENDPFCTNEQQIRLNDSRGDINPDLLDIFQTNFSSQKLVSVYTGWLNVGHIDEVISFVKHTDGQFGFKMLINSPALFLSMWREKTEGEGCVFDTPLERGFSDTTSDQLLSIKVAQEVKYPYSGFMVPSVNGCSIRFSEYGTLQNLIRFNQFIQQVIDKIEIKLCRELGLRREDVIKLPILFTGPDELYSSAIALMGRLFDMPPTSTAAEVYPMIFPGLAGGVYHLSSNLVNSIVSPTFMICDMPHSALPIQRYLEENVISPTGIRNIYYVDTWNSIKYQQGGLHCFTGETRDFTVRTTTASRTTASRTPAAARATSISGTSPRGGDRSNKRSKRRNRTRRVRRTTRYRR